jgi:RNA polymerase-associated protein LEO1
VVFDAEQRHREAMEYTEQDEPDQDPNSLLEQHTEANAAIPNIPIPKSSDGEVRPHDPYRFPWITFIQFLHTKNWVIRMPNFVKVDSKPFHPDTYIGPEQEEEDIASSENIRERSMTIKLKVENTLRWRWVKDAQGHDVSSGLSSILISLLTSPIAKAV